MSILLRRVLGGLIDCTIWGAVAFAILYRDDSLHFLYAYNGLHLGTTMMVLCFVGSESILGYTPGRVIVRVRVASRDFLAPRLIQRVVRALSFWLLLFAATVFTPPLEIIPGNTGHRLIMILSLTWTLALAPLLLLFVGEGRGLHELISNTRSVPSRDLLRRERSSLSSLTLRIGKRPASLLLVTYVVCALGIAMIDWKLNLGPRLLETYNTSGALLQPSIRCPECGTSEILAVQRIFESSDQLEVARVDGWLLTWPGRTTAVTIFMPERVLVDELLSRYQVMHYIIAVISDMPADVEWLVLHLQSRSDFGFFSMSQERRFLFNVPEQTLLTFPTFESSREEGSDLPPKGHLVYRPNIDRTFSAFPHIGAWNPMRFNYLRDWRWSTPVLDAQPGIS